MVLAKRVFRVEADGVWVSGNLRDWCFTFQKWVRDTFNVPENVQQVTVSLHSRSSPNREKGRVMKCECGDNQCPYRLLAFAGKNFRGYDLRSILKPLTGRTVYLEIEYE